MDEQFVFAASVVCLLAGLFLLSLPVRRYLAPANIGVAGALFLIVGVVLMTTFKWTEAAIKISGIEVKLTEAIKARERAQIAFASVQKAISPEIEKQTLETVLANYKKVSDSEPTATQLADFKRALNDSEVTVVPLGALNAMDIFDPINGGQKK